MKNALQSLSAATFALQALVAQAQTGASAAASGAGSGLVQPGGDPTWLVVFVALVVGLAVGYFVGRAARGQAAR